MNWTVYKTTNKINGNFYLGVHKTRDPNDSYLGSGSLLKQAIKKHGVENFVKEILFVFASPLPAFQKEKELVSLHTTNSHCYNMKEGGEGGFDYINNHKLMQKWYSSLSKKEKLEKFSKQGRRASSQCCPIKREENRRLATEIWAGKNHSEETLRIMRSLKTGSKNNQFGKIWVKHPDFKSRCVTKEEAKKLFSQGWSKGRSN